MTTWTVVSRKRGGRFYRPVANVPAGLDWDGAQAVAQSLPHTDDVHVWYVPTTTTHDEDRDNVLEDSGKRFPIRWDAAPMLTYVPPVKLTTVNPLDMPAVTPGAIVTEAHAEYCRENSHATHRSNGEISPYCPRCGDPIRTETPTGSADEVAAFSRELALVLSPRSWEDRADSEARARSMAAHPAGKGRAYFSDSLTGEIVRKMGADYPNTHPRFGFSF